MTWSRTLLTGAILGWFGVQGVAEEPRPTGLTEKVEKRLVQLDVAIEGDRDAIRTLTAKDIGLYVGEHAISGLIVDRLCGDEPAPTAAPESDPSAAEPLEQPGPQPPRPHATFIFFFDQTHLTMAGRALSLETAGELIARLIVGGNRASIVSSGKRLETFVPLTDDRDKLLAGLVRLRKDPQQWDSYAATEDSRIRDAGKAFFDQITAPGVPPPCMAAKAYAREEEAEARKSTGRLGVAVAKLSEVSAPKALVYFGDTLRQKAGLHYLQFGCGFLPEARSGKLTPSAAIDFDALTAEATARGVHFYTIQSEGLRVASKISIGSEGVLRQLGFWDSTRFRQAQDTLVGLAAETGGEAFLSGASNKFIADRIETLTSCRLLLSFPPGDLPRDKPMNVTLAVNVPNVKVQTQGRIVVPSAESIEAARLRAALDDPESTGDGSLRAFLIPRGGDGKRWRASLQLRLRPTGLPDNSAELGASIVRRDRVTDHFASSIATKSASRAMVLEKSLDFPPGDFSVVALARDSKRGDVGSSRIECSWPNPEGSAAAIAPVAVLQTGVAAISTDGVVSSSGLLARDADETLDPSASITLASVVCRGSKAGGTVVVQRWLEGDARAKFETMTISNSGDACVRIVDVVPEGHLQPGEVDYHIMARVGDEIVAEDWRTLRIGTAP